MDGLRSIFICGVAVVMLATVVPQLPEEAEAGMPAPLPTQIPIRDISAPPTPNTPPRPFVRKPASSRRRHVTRHKRHAARKPAAQKPAPQPAAANTSGPRLEQRYEAPTDSLFLPPAKPQGTATMASSGPAAATFPPEPAPAKAAGAPATPQPAPAAAPNQAPAPAPAQQ